MALLDLLGRRWTLRIIWELRESRLTARALRAACDDASPTTLNIRLAELRDAGLIDHDGGYGLTPLGRMFIDAYLPLHDFAERWAAR